MAHAMEICEQNAQEVLFFCTDCVRRIVVKRSGGSVVLAAGDPVDHGSQDLAAVVTNMTGQQKNRRSNSAEMRELEGMWAERVTRVGRG